MIDFLALLFASGVGFGLSCWIFGTVLEKSNNIGDYRGMKSDYRAYVHFRMRKDKMSKGEYESFPRMYAIKLDDSAAPKGTEQVRRLSEEEIASYKKADVPHGAFQSEKNGIAGNRSFIDEYEKWEKENAHYGDLKGVFKPVVPEEDNEKLR